MDIDFVGHTATLPEGCLQILADLLPFTLKQEMIINELEITVSFLTDDEIQRLNKQYRNQNEPTDVLSFPLFEKSELDELDKSIPLSLGDIVISVDRAERQAKEYNHSLIREYCFLAVHGLLHLLGYDHGNEHDEIEMFTKQTEILKEFDIER